MNSVTPSIPDLQETIKTLADVNQQNLASFTRKYQLLKLQMNTDRTRITALNALTGTQAIRLHQADQEIKQLEDLIKKIDTSQKFEKAALILQAIASVGSVAAIITKGAMSK